MHPFPIIVDACRGGPASQIPGVGAVVVSSRGSPPGMEINFATIVHAARLRGEAAIGYRLHRHAGPPPAYGVTLNPPEDPRSRCPRWTA
jgi:hypothetical protein